VENKTSEIKRLRLILLVAVLPLIFVASVILSVILFTSNLIGFQILLLFASLMTIALETIWLLTERNAERKPSEPVRGVSGFRLKEPIAYRGDASFLGLTGTASEAVVATLFEAAGYRVLRQSKVTRDPHVPLRFDMLALKGDLCLVVEVKSRTATTPDITSFIGTLQVADLPVEIRSKRIVPVLIADNFTESVRVIATKNEVRLLPLANVGDLNYLNRIAENLEVS